MCYYNAVNLPGNQVIQLNGVSKSMGDMTVARQPLVSGFNHGLCPVIKKNDGHDFVIAEMEWGFLPEYLRNRDEVNRFRKGYVDGRRVFQPPINTLNAKGEECLFPRKIFRKAALERRCLVLSTGFFEWRHHHALNKKTGQPLKTAVKYPYHIRMKGAAYFFMAGIWQPWTDQLTGEYVETFSIITTAANALLAQVHNMKMRMPVILDDVRAQAWLWNDLEEKEVDALASFQIASESLEAYSIEKDFRTSPTPYAPHVYAELPQLSI
jgi:putative SOS response-associated peptidase YedK